MQKVDECLLRVFMNSSMDFCGLKCKCMATLLKTMI